MLDNILEVPCALVFVVVVFAFSTDLLCLTQTQILQHLPTPYLLQHQQPLPSIPFHTSPLPLCTIGGGKQNELELECPQQAPQ